MKEFAHCDKNLTRQLRVISANIAIPSLVSVWPETCSKNLMFHGQVSPGKPCASRGEV
jgi:hypothetical protein